MLTPLLVFVSAAMLVVAVGFLLLHRAGGVWAADMSEVALAAVQVSIEPMVDGTTQDVILTLRGTPRPHPIAQLNIERADAIRTGMEPPDEFVISDQAVSEDLLVWIPRTPVLLEPGKPRRITFRFSNSDAPARVGVHVAAPMRIGGGLLVFGVRVAVRDERTRETANLRSALMAKARDLGVPAKELPEWPALRALEREIGA